MNVDIPEAASFLFEPARFKIMWGGRAGIKSWSIARALLTLARTRRLRIPCARETMQSIKDSVHQLLEDQITDLGVTSFFRVLDAEIRGRNGSKFTFHGLRDRSVHNIKSLEGADIVWVEEAQNVTKKSWLTLIPTVRKPGSEIWASFNPYLESDDTYQRWVVNPPANAKVVKTSFRDNPYLSEEIKADIEHLKATDPDEYEHVYEGTCKKAVDGAIYKEQLIAAEKDRRFTRVPYDPVRPVDTFWDLGFGDQVSIWFVQAIGLEFRVIDYLSDHLKDVSFYKKELAAKPYVYGRHVLPHDARQRQFAAGGRTVQQQVEAGGWRVDIAPNLSIEDGISAVRLVFNRCIFDADRCADGIQALKHYRYEFDEELKTFKRDPLHDWASHPADAFRMFGVAVKDPPRPKKKDTDSTVYSAPTHTWMA